MGNITDMDAKITGWKTLHCWNDYPLFGTWESDPFWEDGAITESVSDL